MRFFQISFKAMHPLLYLTVFMYISGCGLLHDTQQPEQEEEEITPTLGLEDGFIELDTPEFRLKLVENSQTVAALEPKGADGFDFTPSDRLEERNGNNFYHLGDLNIRLRTEDSPEWERFSTASDRNPVESISAEGQMLTAADLSATLPDDIPLQVNRYWEVDDGKLVLRFSLENSTDREIEIGGLGIPMVFNNNHTEKSLEEAHHENSFFDPYIGKDAGYLQVTRYIGDGPAMLVVPEGQTPFEAYNPLLDDRTPRGITFEGFYEWMAHSRAYDENEWSDADPWNPPTSETIEPGESRSYGVKLLVSDDIRGMEQTLIENDHPVATGIPGYVLPKDQNGQLFLKYGEEISDVKVEPAGALEVTRERETEGGWKSYSVDGREWGRSRLTLTYEDGIEQSIHYKVIKPEEQVVDDMGNFLTTEQWFDDPDDPFDRDPSVISYDYEEREQVTEEQSAWIAGLSDEGGAGSWLAAFMKQLIRPDKEEIEKLESFVDNTLWGGIQYSEGDRKYGVRKSMFYYEPDEMAESTYSDDVNYGGWASWDREEAESVVRSYNYPHVAAAYWVFYRLARNHEGLVTNHSWEWYLERAYETSVAMPELAPQYAQFGKMEGTIFLLILHELQREGWQQAESLEETMRERAEIWEELPFPFGSEMPWDSTGQEEVYAWARYFGFDDTADATLNAILGYMPTVPHWGYNGSARRYWDFIFAGKTSRLERQLHHYGSGLNAIPMLSEYRDNPDDMYLLRVGYGGLMGSIANITQEGFGPSGFHAFPSTLEIDGYSGDYGPGFFGHAVNSGTYIAEHPEFGWLAFGGNIEKQADGITITPVESARSRVFLASAGLWLTLDAGKFKEVSYNPATHDVKFTLEGDLEYTPQARLRIDQPTRFNDVGLFEPETEYDTERGAYVVPFDEQGEAQIHLTDSAYE